jgi:hypothetical protein
MSPEKKYLNWRRQPEVGCVFARLMASDPPRYEQHVVQVSCTGTPAKIASRIANTITTLIQEDRPAAVVIILPELQTLEATARVMLALDAEPLWTVTTSKLKKPPPDDYVALHVVREISFGDGKCPSEALVLGPFKAFPPTRRSPVTAFEVFVGEPRPKGPLDDEDTVKANLAHVELHLPTHNAFMMMWNNSIKGRSKSLGGADNRAKAKVAMVVPASLANRLGCAP